MKRILIAWDLKNVGNGENKKAKDALLSLPATGDGVLTNNKLSSFPNWVKLSLPETMVLADVPDSATYESVCDEIIKIFNDIPVELDKLFVDEIKMGFIYNNSIS